ncbi:MAG: 16S rRNA (adenine(1518)-N(6)/adenine(1519)-N(6))-dimethyltransferase RsmA [Ruminococcaceae bacterium]|nr:16S rRNA (adenine(1518)-N(6)/adenine(1519)-N(6))-dimethyltransferase RsmA [Oscillospiraceae bacterium]
MNLTDLSTVRQLMERHGVAFRKQYGQNFLINAAIPRRIAESCEECDTILEIGPGIGTLTRELSSRAKKVTAFEIDSGLIPILQETLADCPNVTVIHEDFMNTDLPAYLDGSTGVCANLPYYITTPILMKLLESRLPFRFITVMLQKEVAQRLASAPGDPLYGAVTLTLNYFATVEKLFTVGPGNFIPAPKVDSAVIRITPREQPPVQVNEDRFFALVRASFGQRRKTLLNSLSATGLSKELLATAMEEAGIRPDIRGEKLSIHEFAALSNAIDKII